MKLICTNLHQVETIDINKAIRRLTTIIADVQVFTATTTATATISTITTTTATSTATLVLTSSGDN